jgi:hypothetical protein
LVSVGIERAKPHQAFGGYCGEEQMSQNGPYLSQMGPKTGKDRPPDWPSPSPSRQSPATLKGTSHVSPQIIRTGSGPTRLNGVEHRLHSHRCYWTVGSARGVVPGRPGFRQLKRAGSAICRFGRWRGGAGPTTIQLTRAEAYSRRPTSISRTTGAELSSDFG